MMDRLKLEAFVAVAEEASFHAAADQMRVAQSTISSRIKELESHLGQQLFVRTSRQVRLSPSGLAALPAARTALAALASVHQVVDDVAGIRRGTLRLGLVTGADVPEFAESLAAFATEFPGIELSVVSAETSELERAVSAGELDLAIVVRVGPTPLRWTELMRDQLVIVGRHGTVSLAELADEPLIVLDAGAGVRPALESAARHAGTRVSIAFQVSTPAIAIDLHLRGLGLLCIPRSIAPGEGAALVDSQDAAIDVFVGLVSNPGMRTPATELFMEQISAHMHSVWTAVHNR